MSGGQSEILVDEEVGRSNQISIAAIDINQLIIRSFQESYLNTIVISGAY